MNHPDKEEPLGIDVSDFINDLPLAPLSQTIIITDTVWFREVTTLITKNVLSLFKNSIYNKNFPSEGTL